MAYWTDLYVDKNATGTGSGDTPANAIVALANNSIMVAGVRAWVRRTHVESGLVAQFFGATLTSHDRNMIIGWPNSGDPFYDDRPIAATSAGWDSDVASTAIKSVYGLNLPSFVQSEAANVNRPRLRPGTQVFNVCLTNMGIGNYFPWLVDSPCYLDNIAVLTADGAFQKVNMATNAPYSVGRLTVVVSGSGPSLGGNYFIREVVVHSLSSVNSGLLNMDNSNQFINHLINYSSSIDFMFRLPSTGINPITHPARGWFGRVSGVQPYSGMVGYFNSGVGIGPRVDDWYGQGVRMDNGNETVRECSSAEAMFNNARAVIFSVQSWGLNFPYNDCQELIPVVRAMIDVTSGAAINVRVPIYVDSTAIFSLALGSMRMSLFVQGCAALYVTASNLIPGSTGLWTGTRLGGGTAYFASASWVPTETGRVPFEMTPPLTVQSLYHFNYALFGKPEVV